MTAAATNEIASARERIDELRREVARVYVGSSRPVDTILVALLARGHALLEGVPGIAKTTLVKAFATALGCSARRIQFTPDLLPADITGSEVYYSDGGKNEFRFQEGPVFANLVLADEVNRAPAKVQAALLEAMEERQVTVAGTTHKLPELFLVMATQNPIEQEGTYPLPEAQMDRFLMHVQVGYPDEAGEAAIVRLVRGEEGGGADKTANKQDKLVQEVIFAARGEIRQVKVSEAIEKYIVALVFGTREPERLDADLAKWIEIGVSPRGAIGLDKVARAWAWFSGRDYVTPDDVREVVHDVFRHRVILSYEAHASGIRADQALDRIVEKVAVA